jgi:hypothetical protein
MHKCLFCNKHYERAKCLRKHYVKCSIIHNANILNCGEELFEVMKDLMKTNNNLLERVRKLETFSNKDKKRINVVGWLNENKSSVTFERFIEGIEINKKAMKLVYENGIIEGLIQLLSNELREIESKPLYCFEQKSYALYVKEVESWVEISTETFRNKIFYLQRKILKKFREENSIDKLETDREHNIYNKRLMNICVDKLGVKIKNIKNDIYRINKQNINKIVKYDFEF